MKIMAMLKPQMSSRFIINKLVTAGYLSNYAYGYASAAGMLSKEEMYGAAWLAGSLGGQYLGDLNERDNHAMSEGYDQYFRNK
ncbi:MAG: hypothetical protein IPK79_08350 [Vampirovibrionales bacterium]|nr:hypothetical protein [Vampirovibrionales bacterium]